MTLYTYTIGGVRYGSDLGTLMRKAADLRRITDVRLLEAPRPSLVARLLKRLCLA